MKGTLNDVTFLVGGDGGLFGLDGGGGRGRALARGDSRRGGGERGREERRGTLRPTGLRLKEIVINNPTFVPLSLF